MNRISKLYALATALGLVGSAGLLITGAGAAAKAIAALQQHGWDVKPLQAYHAPAASGNS